MDGPANPFTGLVCHSSFFKGRSEEGRPGEAITVESRKVFHFRSNLVFTFW